MIINTAGEYTLQYTATDACGNSTTVERDLVVDAPPRTVLYTDGTLIINEKSRDIDANIQAHGQPTNIYVPFDPNGATDVDKYIFASYSNRPWNNKMASILSVEIGSPISPTSTAYWFYGLSKCTSFNLTALDTSSVTNMSNMFENCTVLTSLDVSNFNTSAVTNMQKMFNGCQSITSLNVSGFNTSAVTDMQEMFNGCRALPSLNVSSFDTSAVTNMSYMFSNCRALTSLDVSNFKTNAVTNMGGMFMSCETMTTLYASSDYVVTQVSNSTNMFSNCNVLVGGAGTTWTSSYRDKTYARIDNPPSAPGYFTAKS